MGVRALRPTQEATDAADPAEPRAGSPATRLLDALRAGDDAAALATCGVATTVTADNMTWSCQGSDEIQSMIALARARFPGLTFESRTRHVGFGLVIEEARVRDVRIDDPSDIDDATETAHQGDDEGPHAEAHPMWDEPVVEARGALTLWKDGHDDHAPPAPLNMPVRVTVRHDDIQVHEITLGFPAALLKRALGKQVDPLEISLSEVQSAFIAPVGAGFTTHTLERPELTLVPTRSAEPEPEPVDPEPPRRRRVASWCRWSSRSWPSSPVRAGGRCRGRTAGTPRRRRSRPRRAGRRASPRRRRRRARAWHPRRSLPSR